METNLNRTLTVPKTNRVSPLDHHGAGPTPPTTLEARARANHICRRRQQNTPEKGGTKPSGCLKINNLTQKTNRKQTEFKAAKSFRFDIALRNKPN